MLLASADQNDVLEGHPVGAVARRPASWCSPTRPRSVAATRAAGADTTIAEIYDSAPARARTPYAAAVLTEVFRRSAVTRQPRAVES